MLSITRHASNRQPRICIGASVVVVNNRDVILCMQTHLQAHGIYPPCSFTDINDVTNLQAAFPASVLLLDLL